MLGLVDLGAKGPVPLLQVRQGGSHSFPFFIPALLVYGNKAREADALMAAAEQMPGTFGINGNGIIDRIGHLGSQEPAPDQLIEPVLLLGQAVPDPFGVQLHMGGPDGFVGILGPGFGLEHMEFSVVISLAIALTDKGSGICHGLVGKPQRVGTHIGNETQGALPCHVYALIQLLGDGHGALGSHVQLPGCLLLQGRGGKGRRGRAAFFAALNTDHRKGLSGDIINDLLYLQFVFQLPLFGFTKIPGSEGTGFAQQLQQHIQSPILPGLEGPDLIFPVHHQTGSHGLNTAGAEAPTHLLPEQGGQLIAHNPVQHTPGLLGIHQVIVNISGMCNGFPHHPLGNLVEGNTAGSAVIQTQQFLQMPGDGFALPVRVRCQIHGVGLGRRFFQLGNNIFFPFDGNIFRFKLRLQVHTQGALGQIPQMAHTGLHHILGAQVFTNGLRLGGRLHNYKKGLFSHVFLHIRNRFRLPNGRIRL